MCAPAYACVEMSAAMILCTLQAIYLPATPCAKAVMAGFLHSFPLFLSLALFSSPPRGGALTCHSQVHTGEGAAKGMCRERTS